MTEELINLAERCERAEEKEDHLLDMDIAKALGCVLDDYTTSLDAAIELVPEGWKPRLDFDARRRCYLHPDSNGLCIGANPTGWKHYADAETMPRAIVAAALRARAAQ